MVDKLLIDKFLSHTESTEFTDFFSLPCDACAGINAAYARGIHRDLTIPNANTAPADCPPETGGTRSVATEGVDSFPFSFLYLTQRPQRAQSLILFRVSRLRWRSRKLRYDKSAQRVLSTPPPLGPPLSQRAKRVALPQCDAGQGDSVSH